MLTNGAAIQRINEVAHVRFLHHRGVIPTRATRKGVQQTLVKVGIQMCSNRAATRAEQYRTEQKNGSAKIGGNSINALYSRTRKKAILDRERAEEFYAAAQERLYAAYDLYRRQRFIDARDYAYAALNHLEKYDDEYDNGRALEQKQDARELIRDIETSMSSL
jgi:hypothetical protein